MQCIYRFQTCIEAKFFMRWVIRLSSAWVAICFNFVTFSCKTNYLQWEIVSAISVSIIVRHDVTVAMCLPRRTSGTLSHFIHSFMPMPHIKYLIWVRSPKFRMLIKNKNEKLCSCRTSNQFQKYFSSVVAAAVVFIVFLFSLSEEGPNSMQCSSHFKMYNRMVNTALKLFLCSRILHIRYVYYANVENYNCKLLFLPLK